MADGQKTAKSSQSERRRQRLAEELRSNLRKRKQQARVRAGAGRDERLAGKPARQT